jgi:hypothetical protein
VNLAHHLVTDTEHEVATEMSDNIADAIARLRLTPCLERRLDEISALVDAAAKAGRLAPIGVIGRPLAPIGVIGRPPESLWTHGAWDSRVAAQITSHIDPHRVSQLTGTYQFVDRLEDANRDNHQSDLRPGPMGRRCSLD